MNELAFNQWVWNNAKKVSENSSKSSIIIVVS